MDKHLVTALMESSSTITDRDTFYANIKGQQKTFDAIWESLLKEDSTLPIAILSISPSTNFMKQYALKWYLSNPSYIKDGFIKKEEVEALIYYLLDEMNDPQQVKGLIKLLGTNNAKTKKICKGYILNHPNLEFVCVKYRQKLDIILTHAVGITMSHTLRLILKKKTFTENEQNIIKTALGNVSPLVLDSVSYILGNENPWNTNKFVQYKMKAKKDPSFLKQLPPEVAEGIRGKYHPKLSAIVVETGSKMASKVQKQRMGKRAEKAGIKVDVVTGDLYKDYLHVLNDGPNKKTVLSKIEKSAEELAKKLGFSFGKVAVIVDSSTSMRGSAGQLYRPYAIALAHAKLIEHSSETCYILGVKDKPHGITDLASLLIEALELKDIDNIFVLSDGYENSMAGEFEQVKNQAYAMGYKIPIYHLNPVFAPESLGNRLLSANGVFPMTDKPAELVQTIKSNLMLYDEKKWFELLKMQVLENVEKGLVLKGELKWKSLPS